VATTSGRSDWKIGRRGRACDGCGAAFPPATPFHAAIWAEGEAFRRRDLCAACFRAAPSPPYSHWLTAIPRPDARKRVFDLGLAAEFLRRLAGEADPGKAALAHLLALLLARKKLVRLEPGRGEDGAPRARVEFHDGREPEEIEIPAPPLREEDVAALRDQLAELVGV